MDWLAGSRLHLVDVIVTRGLVYVPIFVLGFSRTALATYVFIVAAQATFIHANVRWEFRPLRRILATPAFHHWHNAAERDAIDKNFRCTRPAGTSSSAPTTIPTAGRRRTASTASATFPLAGPPSCSIRSGNGRGSPAERPGEVDNRRRTRSVGIIGQRWRGESGQCSTHDSIARRPRGARSPHSASSSCSRRAAGRVSARQAGRSGAAHRHDLRRHRWPDSGRDGDARGFRGLRRSSNCAIRATGSAPSSAARRRAGIGHRFRGPHHGAAAGAARDRAPHAGSRRRRRPPASEDGRRQADVSGVNARSRPERGRAGRGHHRTRWRRLVGARAQCAATPGSCDCCRGCGAPVALLAHAAEPRARRSDDDRERPVRAELITRTWKRPA